MAYLNLGERELLAVQVRDHDGIHGNFRSHAICATEAIRTLGAFLAGKRSE